VSKSALRLWKLDAGSSTSSAGSPTFWCLPEPLPPAPPSLLEILVPSPTLICPFMFLLYLSTVGELDSLFPYFPIFSVYVNILAISIPHPVPTICLYREYSVWVLPPLLIPECVVHTYTEAAHLTLLCCIRLPISAMPVSCSTFLALLPRYTPTTHRCISASVVHLVRGRARPRSTGGLAYISTGREPQKRWLWVIGRAEDGGCECGVAQNAARLLESQGGRWEGDDNGAGMVRSEFRVLV